MSAPLVFGASGAIGRYLLPRMGAHAGALPVSRIPRPGWLCADLGDTRVRWPDAEIALSLGPLDAFAGWLERGGCPGLRRIVAFSSMSVRSKRDSVDAAERALALRLSNAEATLQRFADRRQIDWTILRPTLIYGAGTDKTLAPIARFAQRWRVLPIPFGADGLRQPVHARDLAAAVLAVVDNAATFGKTYELGGGERLRFDAMVRRLAHGLSGFVLPLPVPQFALRLLPATAMPRGALARLRQPLIADIAAATRDFGFSPAAFIPGDVWPPPASV